MKVLWVSLSLCRMSHWIAARKWGNQDFKGSRCRLGSRKVVVVVVVVVAVAVVVVVVVVVVVIVTLTAKPATRDL